MWTFFYLAIGLFWSCATSKELKPNSKHPERNGTEELDVQGHRGCRGLMPENTWPAMRLALDLAVTTLEMDVVVTSDNKVVLSHEPWFNHQITTRPDGTYFDKSEEKQYNIFRMKYEEVKQFDVGIKPYPQFPKQQKIRASKPLLSDVVDSVQKYMLSAMRPHPYYNIEIKSTPAGDGIYHPEAKDFAELVLSQIKSKRIEPMVVIQSFDIRPLQYIHQHYPHIKIGLLINSSDNRTPDEQLKTLGFTPAIYSPHYSLVTDDLVHTCQQKGLRVIPWTVNEKTRIDKLKGLGVDGIITDYPNLFLP